VLETEQLEFKYTLYEKSDGIATITINRPEVLNAINEDTLREMLARLDDAEKDGTVRVIILTGAGNKAFSAGADLKMFKVMSPIDATKNCELGQSFTNRMENFPKPIIAAINGYALGGGTEMALACDIRIASDNAQMGQTEINVGTTIGWGGTQRLPRLVGKGVAKEMIFTGKRIDANTAERLGLVNAVVPYDQLKAKVQEIASELARKPPIAIRLMKALINSSSETHITEGLRQEAQAFGLASSAQDFLEGVTAFLEKRQPVYKGK
jgi:enoyl-CoA hydratase